MRVGWTADRRQSAPGCPLSIPREDGAPGRPCAARRHGHRITDCHAHPHHPVCRLCSPPPAATGAGGPWSAPGSWPRPPPPPCRSPASPSLRARVRHYHRPSPTPSPSPAASVCASQSRVPRCVLPALRRSSWTVTLVLLSTSPPPRPALPRPPPLSHPRPRRPPRPPVAPSLYCPSRFCNFQPFLSSRPPRRSGPAP